MTTKTSQLSKRLINSARTDSKRIHITPRLNGWAIRKEGSLRALKVVSDQYKAIEIAQTYVENGLVSKIIVHSKNGEFRTAK